MKEETIISVGNAEVMAVTMTTVLGLSSVSVSVRPRGIVLLEHNYVRYLHQLLRHKYEDIFQRTVVLCIFLFGDQPLVESNDRFHNPLLQWD